MVTGGAGFIGSALVRTLIRDTACEVLTVDKLTYAGNREALAEVLNDPRHSLEVVDIRDRAAIAGLLSRFRPDALIHLAAETHVDRSIDDPSPFIHTNIVGTFELLEAVRAWLLGSRSPEHFRLLHVSTDEVFGDLDAEDAPWSERSRYDPHSPYSASKAGSDHLVRAWHRTYGLPILVSNSSNNFGAWQHPEKLIPLTITRALAGEPLPIYGDGSNVRDWLYVDDNVTALLAILAGGQVGRTYNVGAGNERTNLAVVRAICDHLDRTAPRDASSYRDLIRFVDDRPGHDFRCAIDSGKVCEELGWKPRHDFESALARTVDWYCRHRRGFDRPSQDS
ncbi:dTDP-glucose 4,6-dehydratase [Lentisalinibacter sediminis]|uniref:dTDP-glucose 4,6-dehydratase n=1 Tax=Lentisalinibacter sediminis TaxID=2992237 RepID=UPI00386A6100